MIFNETSNEDGTGFRSVRQVLSGENMPRANAINWDNRISDIQVEPGCQFTGYDFYLYRTGGWSPKTWTGYYNSLFGSAYYEDISSWKCSCGRTLNSILHFWAGLVLHF